MSCSGCRVLRKGCNENCILRQSLQGIETPQAQAYATVFVAKFFGRAGLMSFLSAVPDSQRPPLFQSLLFEACGRTVNPINGAVGLLWTGNWHPLSLSPTACAFVCVYCESVIMAICCYESAASKLISISTSPPTNPSKPNTCFFSVSQTLRLRCNLSLPSKTLVTEPQPLFTSVKSFAPATVANLGPGFDFLGCAVDGIGDFVTLRLDPQVHAGEISISDINGNSSTKLSKNPLWNCAGIAAIAVMKMLNIRSVGLSLSLHKGLPLGSGLGSSAASAAAAAVAVNEMFGGPLSVSDLVLAGLESESKVSGYHADNVAPAIMGGFVLIRSYDPLELIRLNFPNEKDLFFVLVTPEFEAPTKKMRAALPTEITMSHHVWNCSQAGALVASVLQGDLKGLGRALSSDKIVEPRRAPLIPGMEAVKKAAMEAGAFGCTISGAGPTAVAVIDDEERGREIGDRMIEAFIKEGNLKASAMVNRLDRVGARLVTSIPR